MRKLLRLSVATLLRFEVALYLKRHPSLIVAVTGVTGKTSVKRAILDELKRRGVAGVRAHPKCYNTDIGLPLAILMVEPGTFDAKGWSRALLAGFKQVLKPRSKERQILVTEYGISEPGDMRILLGIARPHIVVVTDIVDHPQSRARVDDMLSEIRLLTSALESPNVLILNADSSSVMELATSNTAATVTNYGQIKNATYHAEQYTEDGAGIHFMLNGKQYHLLRHGEAQLSSALAAVAVADAIYAIP